MAGDLDVVEERDQRPGEGPDGTGDEHGLVAGGAVLPDPPDGVGREPREHVAGQELVGDLVEVVEPGPLVLPVDAAQEVAARAPLGLHQARHPGAGWEAHPRVVPARNFLIAAWVSRGRSTCGTWPQSSCTWRALGSAFSTCFMKPIGTSVSLRPQTNSDSH